MKNLRELVKEIQLSYPSDKYLYRGERKAYPTIQSTSSRNPDYEKLKPEIQNEINSVITGHNIQTGYKYDYFHEVAGLYYYLRDVFYNIAPDDNSSTLEIESHLFGILQHYGFPTALIDLTDDIKVAAYFASANGIIGNEGRMTIVPKDSLKDFLFDSTSSTANRPSRQRAHFLLLPKGYDLLSKHFEKNYKALFLYFRLSEDDKIEFDNPDFLSISNDQTATHIVDWYDIHVKDNPKIDQEVKNYLKVFIDRLR